MVLRPLLQHLTSALLIGLFLALGLLTFGKPFLFDRIFFTSLFIIAFAFRNDVNLLGVTLIIIVERLVEETAYLLIIDSLSLKVVTYLFCIFALFLRRNDSLFYLTLTSLCIMIGAEIYWFINDYRFLNTHWYIFLISLNLFVRKAISSRCFWTLELAPNKNITPLKVDYYVYQLALYFIVINLVTLAEYLARHLFSLNSLLIYNLYALTNHILAFIFLFLLADQAIKVTRRNKIKV
ncbi:hypothetical protein [Alteromonas sp. a30]|uniref:hypothetical protein n=1 Tax=Alteromonas sp. a30 TaxID=2730917 RepID=UPI00227EF499|nr:hypothetical protein [Alteromonas sp. a30]MCY7297291.1 hypothetical protein [Alteromonas sp. a30]